MPPKCHHYYPEHHANHRCNRRNAPAQPGEGARIEIQDLRTSAAQPPTTTIQKKSANLKKTLIKKKTSDLGKNPIFFAPAARIFLAAFGGQNH